MPKARRSRSSLTHESSVKLHKRTFAVQDNAVERVEIGTAAETSGNDILASLETPEGAQETLTKKEKQALKREAFLQKLGAFKTPHSRSHVRRIKRKAKEQLAGGGLADIQAILSSIADDAPRGDGDGDEAQTEEEGKVEPGRDPRSTMEDRGQQPKSKSRMKQGKIGQGKSVPLSRNQRKQALTTERFRQPLIRSNPDFAKSPFETIRTHAQNTLIKHQAPS